LVNNIQVLSDAEASWHRMFEGHYTTSRIYEGTNDITGDIIFATPASLAGSERLENLIKNRRISMVIVDEVHHLPAETPKQIFRRIEEESINQNWKTGFLGLTATETRPDNESVIAFFGNDIHYEYPIKSGWRDGYLVKWKYQAGDLDINPEGVGPIIPGAEIYERYRALRYDKSRFKNLFKLYRREAKRVLIPKGLIISSKVQKAKDLAAYFRKRGVHAITLVGEDRTTDKVRFEHSYEAWKTGHWPEGSPYANDPVPEVVVGVDIFREGVDVPAINILMLWDDTNSTIEFVQSVGRGLRIAPFKNYISVIDTVGLFRKLSLLRYLGSLTIKRKRGGKKVGGIEDEDDTDELPEDDVGLDKNVSAAVNRYFDDIPSQLIYRFKRYENIPDSGFKKLDKWIAVRSRFAKVSVAVGEEDPEETALVTYLRNFSREYLLDSGRLTSEAIREFRERFAHVFDIDASLNTPAAKDFVMREESYLVYRRLGVLFHQADRRIDLKVLETIYPEFDEEHQRALRNRAENLQFFRKAILRLTPQEALDYGLTVLQKAKVDRLVYSDWLEAVEIGATTEDSIIYMAENPIKQGGSSILGGRLKNKAQYHQYSQEEVMQTYLTDPKYKELLTPDDFKLPHDAFVKLTREKLLLDDAKSLEIYLDQLGKAIQSYIAALRFEDQRAELPARRNDLTVLIQHEMFQRVVALELMTPELFKKWFDLYWAAYQEGRFQSGSEAVIHTWFTELASSLGFFFMLPIPGLSHINLQVYRGSYNTYEISLLQQTSIGTYAGRHSSELTVTPSGDIIFNTDGTDFESFFESLDGRAQGFITEELAAMVGKIYDVSAYQASRQVLVLAPNEAKLTLALRDFFFNQTDWDVFSESAMNASSPEERQKWRLTLFDHVPPGVQYIMVESSASDNPKQTKRKQKLPPGVAANLGVESAIYRTYVRYFNYWNYWRLQAEEGVRGIETRAEGKLPSESLLAKALPFIKSSLLRVIHDGTQGDFLDTNEFLPSAVTISDALGFYADQETISEERLRLANVYLFTLQRKARQYHGNKPYETFGKPFTTWKDVSTIRGTLANVISFYRQVYFAGIQVPASFEEKLDAYLTMVEEDSSRIQYKQQSAAISLLIEEMISKIKVGIPLSSDADDGGALALPAFSVPIYYDGQLQVVAHPKDPARPSVGSILHLDPSHSDIPKGGVAKLVAIDDADQFDTVCAVCFKAAFGDNPGLKQNVKGLRDYQDENVDSAEPISDDDYWTLGATLRSEVRLQNKSNQPLSEEVISTGIGDLFLTHLTDRPISKGARQRAQAILRSIPALQVVFNKVESVYQDGNRTAVLKSELASQASREMRDFMKSEFSDLAQSGQGVLFGIRIPDSSAASHGRIQTVVAFIQSFLPQSDLTYNHAIITGTADLPPMLRESLKSVGVHTASSRRVASLLGQYGQAIFPEVVLDSRFESKGLDVPARSVELRETQGETRDTETMAVELEAIHAFALARYGDGDALRSFYQRLSSSVSLFKQYPDILYSAIIQSSGNNRDYVDMSILSAYLNLLTAQLAATQQLAQSA